MPYSRPTLSKLKALVLADIQSKLPGSDPFLRFSNLNIIGIVQAVLSNAHYGYLDWIAKQAVPYTAEDEYLYAWGALKNVIPIAAAKSTNGEITFPGSDGSIIEAGATITRSDGTTYTVTAEATVSSGTVVVGARADDAGDAGNAVIGTSMTLDVGVEGVQSTGTVTKAFTNGADAETLTSYRTRMLQVYANPPQGGAKSDYVEWALQIAGVTRAWCNPNGFGAGTVVVYTMFDVQESAHNGYPQGTDGVAADETRGVTATGDQLTVADYIFSLRPVTALVYSVCPLQQAVNFTITGITTSTLQTIVTEAIADLFKQSGDPTGATIPIAAVWSAIASASGLSDFIVNSPIADIITTVGYLPVIGEVTFN